MASKLSLGSRNSVLSIGSVNSVLSVGSVGSALSIGSTGSFASIGSFASSASVAAAFSFLSRKSAFSAFSVGGQFRWRARNALTTEQRDAVDKKRARVATIAVAGIVAILGWKYADQLRR
jgi:hypothetical protein